MEVFPEELQSVDPFDKDIEEILHPFQNQKCFGPETEAGSFGSCYAFRFCRTCKTITAAAIIKQYIEDDRYICTIPPASLRNAVD